MRIGVDSGGTFTDFVVLGDAGNIEYFKLPSNPTDPASVVLEGVRRIGRTSALRDVVHGSTVATNALLERKGARTAFVTSPGFRDLLAIGRQYRHSLCALNPEERTVLVPHELTFEWFSEPQELVAQLEDARAESVAVCLLGSYRNGEEERAVRSYLERFPYVALASEISPEFREYERASTVVLNAYVAPLMHSYLEALEKACPCPLLVMQSSGGLLTASEAGRHAVRTILSGPAGGVIAARWFAALAGFSRGLSFDMGGTSTDVSLLDEPMRLSMEAYVESLPIRAPMLDIHTVGAGGGSVARVDAAGRLSVGPESVGSQPGPACYGRGDLPSTTDAHVVLGRMVPERFLDGSISINPDRARRAVGGIARQLSLSVEDAAAAIVRIANSNMERAVRVVSVERGQDTRDLPLIAFGGGGGLHACEMAEELGISVVVFPEFAGALSALGMLLADRTRDYAAGVLGLAQGEIEGRFSALEAVAARDQPGSFIERYADIRYAGQSYELTVPWNPTSPRDAFEAAFKEMYGFSNPSKATEVVTARIRATVPVARERFRQVIDRKRESTPPSIHRIYHGSAWRQVPAFERASLPDSLPGPALVFDYGSTLFIPDGWLVDPHPGYAIARRTQSGGG